MVRIPIPLLLIMVVLWVPELEAQTTHLVDPSTMHGKVLVGYQGWFRCEGDGNDLGWTHYRGTNGKFEPGDCSIDLWPDISEYPSGTYETPFRHADGSVARVFSSTDSGVVDTHFRWMKEYGIDGAFVQRFAVTTRPGKQRTAGLKVLGHCQTASSKHGRVYAVMYDTDFDAKTLQNIRQDWIHLMDQFDFRNDPSYLRHRGKPVVALWGCGFEHRKWDAQATKALFRFLKEDPVYGQLSIMLGIPTHWRALAGDCHPDPSIHEAYSMADVLSPWMVGRVQNPEEAMDAVERFWKPDMAWCSERSLDYLPVVFPGFSWQNLNQGQTQDQILRLGGKFLWSQYVAAKQAGATMVYQAMFDEMDEGTAIFKCTNDPPIGASPFLTYEGLPSDHYLWLTGQGRRLIRGEISKSFPKRREFQASDLQ